jgi:CheY-like chemotaxis protein
MSYDGPQFPRAHRFGADPRRAFGIDVSGGLSYDGPVSMLSQGKASMTILLIVDDDRTNRLRMAQITRSLGYLPLLASDGARALTILEDNPDIDLVITDCQMPVMDGPALISALRESGNSVPLLVYSAYRSIEEVSALLDKGADYFLPYPVSRESLGYYVGRIVAHRKKGGGEAVKQETKVEPFSPA